MERGASNIGLLEIARVLKASWLFISVVTLSFAVGATTYALSLDNVYVSKVTLAYEGKSGQVGLTGSISSFAQLAGFTNSSDNNIQKHIAMFQSRSFFRYFNEKALSSKNISQLDSYDYFKANFSLVLDKNSGLLYLSVSSEDSSASARYANIGVVAFNEYLRQKEVERIDRSIEFLNNQLANSDLVEMKSMLYGLLESQVKEKMFANAKQDFMLSVIDDAAPALVHTKPNRPVIFVVGAILGLFLSSIMICVTRIKWLDVYEL